MNAPTQFTRAADTMASSVQNLINQLFTDANGATAGNQTLGVNSAVLARVSVGGGSGTALLINDSNAGFQSDSDLLINVTGLTGTLPALGNISVSSFFI
jgi:hypothetical protein